MPTYHSALAAAELLDHHGLAPPVLIDLDGQAAVLRERFAHGPRQRIVVGGPGLIGGARILRVHTCKENRGALGRMSASQLNGEAGLPR